MSSSRESSGDFSDLNNPHTNDPALVTHHLVEEIRQAVNEANQRGDISEIKRDVFSFLNIFKRHYLSFQ